jgi:hypothetical protein
MPQHRHRNVCEDCAQGGPHTLDGVKGDEALTCPDVHERHARGELLSRSRVQGSVGDSTV